MGNTKFRRVAYILALLLIVGIIFFCFFLYKKPEDTKKPVELSVWCDGSSKELIRQIVDEFKEEYKQEEEFDVTISEESELSCKDTVLANPKGAADIFAFADDQFEDLLYGGALLEITEEMGDIIAENGGGNSGAILASQKDGKLYAYPMTAGNGYFLYYDASYYDKEDVKTMDGILKIAAQKGKKVMMDFSSGWYIYSFFKGAGLEVNANAEHTQNICNWNAVDTRYKGVDVAKGMLSIARKKGFKNGDDDAFVEGIQKGTVIAGINGAWNAAKVEKALGKNYAAAKLPTYTLHGDQVQMRSFAGYKLVGVNSHTKNPKWAMRLARYITNEKNQLKRFHFTGECPSNMNAAASEDVRKAPAFAALTEQNKYAHVQRVCDTFWTPTNVFGMIIANGNKDNKELQSLLDKMVEDITTVSHEE